MKKYSIIHIPVLSFYSKDLYRDIGLNWRGTALGYLFLLLLICWIPAMLKFHYNMSGFIENEVPKAVSKFPEITIKDGELSADVNQPYYIPDINEAFIIIDTTGTITSLEDSNAVFLITKTEAVYKESNVKTETLSFKDIEDFTLNQAKINKWINIFQKKIMPLTYPFVVISSYAFRIIQVLIYAAVGMIFTSSLNVRIPYVAMLRLAVAAVTPCIIIKTALGLMGVSFCGTGLMFIAIALAYLYYGVKSVSEDRDQPPHEYEFTPDTDDFIDQT